MAYGRNNREKGSQSSRGSGSRYQDRDNRLYEEEQPYSRRRVSSRHQDGYGVGDSYDRQEEFGRPEGSWHSEQAGYRGRDEWDEDFYGQNGQEDEDRPGRRQSSRPHRWENDPYDDRYEGGYENFDETDGRKARYTARRPQRRTAEEESEPGRRSRQDAFEPVQEPVHPRNAYGTAQESSRLRNAYGTAQESSRLRDAYGTAQEPSRLRDAYGTARQPAYPSGSRKSKKRGKSRFIVRLVLLIILSAVLFGVYRFSRLDRVHLGNILKNEGIQTQKGYQNFVIYGVDSREGQLTKDSHSDTIVICSINKSTKDVKMVSVYRDTYLDNTNGEFRKATECYFFGGPERSINMLNKNLDLDISDYVAVNFNAVVKAVDLIGGVEINVTEDELPYINGYQTENAQVTGAQITPVTSAGYQHLNGIQALAYCRIRYTSGDDYKRTERQRNVLTQVFEIAKKEGTTKMLQVADAMLPYISTSFSNTEIMGLVSEMSGLTLGDSTGFPFEQQPADTPAGDCVVPVNLAANVKELHAFLFGQNDYTPTSTVQSISQQIVTNTGIG